MTTTPELADIIERISEAGISAMWTALPGYVAAVHADKGHQFIDVIPSVQEPYRDDAGELAFRSFPTLPAVPVAQMAGGGFFISLPLAVGDSVTVIFSQLAIDIWLKSGAAGDGKIDSIAGGEQRTHGPAGAIALPMGPRPLGSVLADVDGESLQIALDGAEKPSLTMAKDGTVTIVADVTITGALAVDGAVTVTGDVSSDGEVKADAAGSGVALGTHKHIDAMGSTQGPTPGT